MNDAPNDQPTGSVSDRDLPQEAFPLSIDVLQGILCHAYPEATALLDHQGRVVFRNRSWTESGCEEILRHQGLEIGDNYLEACERAEGEGSAAAHTAASGLHSVLTGDKKQFTFECPSHSPVADAWYRFTASAIAEGEFKGAMVLHADHTDRRKAQEALRLSQERFQSLIEHSCDAIMVIGADGVIGYASPSVQQVLGYSAEKLAGHSAFEFMHPDDLERTRGLFAEILQHPEKIITAEFRYRHQNGSWPWLEAIGQNLIRQRSVKGIVCNFRDITERKQNEDVLRQSERRYRAFIQQSSEAIWRIELKEPLDARLPEGEQIELLARHCYLAECNLPMARLHGFSDCSEIIGRPISEFLVFTDSNNIEFLKRLIQSGYQLMHAVTHEVDRHGVSKYFLNNVVGIFENDRLTRFWGSQIDVTRQKKAEDQLRVSEARFRAMSDASPLGIFVTDAAGGCLYANPASLAISGLSREEVHGDGWSNNVHPEDRGRVWSRWVKFAARPEHFESVHRFLRRDGSVVWVSVKAAAMRDGQRVLGYAGTLEDITDRKITEEHLLNSQGLYHSLVEHLPQFIFRKDLEGKFIFANQRFCKSLGKTPDQILGKTDADLFPPEFAEKYRKDDQAIIQSGKTFEATEEYQLPDGGKRYIEVVKIPLYNAARKVAGVQGIFWDITERRNLEEQLRQSQKMESVGQLAGGIAHEYNNTVTIILGYASLLLFKQTLPTTAHPPLKEIVKAADRLAELTKQLLMFSRRQVTQLQKLDLNKVLSSMATMLRPLLGETIELMVNPGEFLPLIQADSAMLQQVILNLSLNARDAMPRGGRLILSARPVMIAPSEAEQDPDMVPGLAVRLTVQDFGTGIKPEHLPRVFEPFFTTKEIGKGTGLGLATVYGIVKQHGGWIRVESQLGLGSAFHVFFPVPPS